MITCEVKQEGTTIECQWSESVPEGYLKRLFGPENAPNIGLFFVGLFGIVAAVFTLRAIRLQAKAQMDADRAWVLVRIAGQPEEPLTGKIITTGAIPGIVWKIRIVGNTPAQITREQYRCRTVRIANGKPLLEEIPTYLTNETVIKEAEVFPPDYEYGMNIPLEPTADRMTILSQMAEVVAGLRAFCAYGKIEYKDAFGRRGESQFCATYRLRLGGVMKSPDGIDLNPPGFYISGPKGYNYTN
jgi:hypothetical protein